MLVLLSLFLFLFLILVPFLLPYFPFALLRLIYLAKLEVGKLENTPFRPAHSSLKEGQGNVLPAVYSATATTSISTCIVGKASCFTPTIVQMGIWFGIYFLKFSTMASVLYQHVSTKPHFSRLRSTSLICDLGVVTSHTPHLRKSFTSSSFECELYVRKRLCYFFDNGFSELGSSGIRIPAALPGNVDLGTDAHGLGVVEV